MDRSHRQAGFTLVEALVALAILGLVMAIAAPALDRWLLRVRHRVHLESVQSDLQWARQLALSGHQPIQLRVNHSTAGSCYILFAGPQQACSCQVGGAAQCLDEAQVLKTHDVPATSRLRLSATASALRFEPRYATVTPTATFSIAAPDGERGDQVVALTGRVRTCVTHRSLYNAPACAA
ncbi:GspH/FimT family pseudopilin [Inhella gelatinilytica]|uniref:Type II secretion system protein H n=1 Tax=Inhella gelatinilytica TaxID=2795030 RepID=A0A931IXQ1_9BURK|nr:GspH/FimT family pseudopilin [Inhella gelatinilytica]MBH9552989.1 GspH/FimT family pseudopilin [Inhella gelatinilytica]